MTNWLINYSEGFVRRGLLGSYVLKVHDLFGIPPVFTIIATYLVWVGLAAYQFGVLVFKRSDLSFRAGWFIFLAPPLLISGIVSAVYSPEMYFYVFAAAQALLIGTFARRAEASPESSLIQGRNYAIALFLLCLTVGVSAELCHEIFAIFVVPISLIATIGHLKKLNAMRWFWLAILGYLPILLILVASKQKPTTPEHLQMMLAPWVSLLGPKILDLAQGSGAVGALVGAHSYSFSITKLLYPLAYSLMWLVDFSINMIVVWMLFTRKSDAPKKPMIPARGIWFCAIYLLANALFVNGDIGRTFCIFMSIVGIFAVDPQVRDALMRGGVKYLWGEKMVVVPQSVSNGLERAADSNGLLIFWVALTRVPAMVILPLSLFRVLHFFSGPIFAPLLLSPKFAALLHKMNIST